MTRLEAISKAQNLHEQHKLIKLIAEVYDDLENQTCSNCTHRKVIAYVGFQCDNLGEDINIPSENFACNKWRER